MNFHLLFSSSGIRLLKTNKYGLLQGSIKVNPKRYHRKQSMPKHTRVLEVANSTMTMASLSLQQRTTNQSVCSRAALSRRPKKRTQQRRNIDAVQYHSRPKTKSVMNKSTKTSMTKRKMTSSYPGRLPCTISKNTGHNCNSSQVDKTTSSNINSKEETRLSISAESTTTSTPNSNCCESVRVQTCFKTRISSSMKLKRV